MYIDESGDRVIERVLDGADRKRKKKQRQNTAESEALAKDVAGK